jgi:hypothetical protein
MINQTSLSRQFPALADLSTRQLVVAIMGCWAAGITGDASPVLPGKDVTVVDLRSELRRREGCAVELGS